MGHVLMFLVAAGVAGTVGFGVARTAHDRQLPQPVPSRFAAEAAPAASQIAAVLGGPAFRNIVVPAAPSGMQALPPLPNAGGFAFDTITLTGGSHQRHRMEGTYQRRGDAWSVTVEHCDGAAVIPPHLLTWTPQTKPSDDIGRVVDAAVRAALRLDAATRPATGDEPPRVTIPLDGKSTANVPASFIRDGIYQSHMRDGLDECCWIPATTTWQSRMLTASQSTVHAASMCVREAFTRTPHSIKESP